MTTEANNTTERKTLDIVQRIVASRLENENAKIQKGMEALGEDFTYYLGWKCEDISLTYYLLHARHVYFMEKPCNQHRRYGQRNCNLDYFAGGIPVVAAWM